MSAGDIDILSLLWAATLAKHKDSPPLQGHTSLYDTIDSIPFGDMPWQSVTMHYTELDESQTTHPAWQKAEYDVWFRDPRTVIHNILANPDFRGEFDYTPIRDHVPEKLGGGLRRRNFMSGDWAWNQATQITANPETHGSMFVPLILGSDKTTVSVATGQNEYWPLYLSIGNVHNNVRRAHRNALVVIEFLAIPKTDKKYADDPLFCTFRRQLVHAMLSKILETLKPNMTKWEVVQCPDGHFRRAIYGIGPYIADYPKQALLTCIVQGWCPKLSSGDLWNGYGIVAKIVPFTNDFPRADIHELIASDILHQLIKGTFKDHLVTWVEEYLNLKHGKVRANEILANIDRRISCAPHFSNLRRFPEGRRFKQWTGNDSKALMKVWLPAIVGKVPVKMVKAIRAFLDFCYIARREVFTDTTLADLDDALHRFHKYRKIFQTTGVRPEGFALPRQHSLKHWKTLIRKFGAPNGLDSSITESKHIEAVKDPWRRSNRYHALGQMLLTNQRMDKLAAMRVDLKHRGLLEGSVLTDICRALDIAVDDLEQSNPWASHILRNSFRTEAQETVEKDSNDDTSEETAVDEPKGASKVRLAKTYQRHLSRDVRTLAIQVRQPRLLELMRRFLYDQTRLCPDFEGKVYIYYSAAATYFAPSDPSGIGGMHREHIRATPTWFGTSYRFDCVFVGLGMADEGIYGRGIARIRLFLSFKHRGVVYPCALVHWNEVVGNRPDKQTGMWLVQPEYLESDGSPYMSIIHLDMIERAAHLMPQFPIEDVPVDLAYHQSLEKFNSFYVNHYIDHHAFDIIFSCK
ncbi:hypothetical protein CERSUDRAFT_67025 [Gelatoporia subvermispora B]|uniref:Uncharacterized protein n=1 Tax=Ceriporiopsis subvermispora (strain B) TaxID=914234 RepID=M2R815_CERS8|nr:hypothetical protein CERSUDRAFT_67025 [Gelatoporia subvermispora B]